MISAALGYWDSDIKFHYDHDSVILFLSAGRDLAKGPDTLRRHKLPPPSPDNQSHQELEEE
jgi:hypothetical protein